MRKISFLNVCIAILILPVLSLMGCFQMGLPEHVATPESYLFNSSHKSFSILKNVDRQSDLLVQARKLNPTAVILSPKLDPTSVADSFGHQFILGIFPLTRIFLQHGPEVLLEELSAAALEAAGYQVLIVPEELIAEVENIQASSILRFDIDGLSVNAYDVLFFRIAAVSGYLSLAQVDPISGQEIRRLSQQLDISEYRKQAQAPTLAALLEKELKSKIEVMLKQLRPHRPSVLARQGDASVTAETRKSLPGTVPRYLKLPALLRPPPPALGALLASSYGFDSVSPYPTSGVRRILQRGISAALRLSEVPTIVALSDQLNFYPLAELEVAVSSLTVKDNTLEGELVFDDFLAGELQAKATCKFTQRRISGVDGAWVVSLEHAAGLAALKFTGAQVSDVDASDDSKVDCTRSNIQ